MERIHLVLKSTRGRYLKLTKNGNFVGTWNIDKAQTFESLMYCEKVFKNSKLWKKAFIIDKISTKEIKSLIG